MNADAILQELSISIYEAPLSDVRKEADYPYLGNPLHIAVFLIDCDTEIDMNGMLRFIENSAGQHLDQTAEALKLIGAPKSASLLQSVRSCMERHGVTWQRLRSDFAGTAEYEISSFRELHGEDLDGFAREVDTLAGHFSLFNTLYSTEDSYAALCSYLDGRAEELRSEIERRRQ